jgi:hypothetical protein
VCLVEIDTVEPINPEALRRSGLASPDYANEVPSAEPNLDTDDAPELHVEPTFAAPMDGDFDQASDDLTERPVAGSIPPDRPERVGGSGNDPAAVLELWTALEVLSPQTYLQPTDLADGDPRRIAI